MNRFCGIDWAEDHHDVAVIDADGQLVIKRRITDDAGGFAELLGMLESVGDAAERVRVRAIIDHLQLAVHTGGPAVLDPLRHALFTAHPDG